MAAGSVLKMFAEGKAVKIKKAPRQLNPHYHELLMSTQAFYFSLPLSLMKIEVSQGINRLFATLAVGL